MGQEARLRNRATVHRTADLTGYFAAPLLDGYGLRGRKHLATSQGSTATDLLRFVKDARAESGLRELIAKQRNASTS
jgi:hypothetical protein